VSRREEYEAKTEALLQPMVDERGFELVDVEYVKEGSNWYLRAFIDKPGYRWYWTDKQRTQWKVRPGRFYKRCLYIRSKFSGTWKTIKER